MSQRIEIVKRTDPKHGPLFEFFDGALQRIRDRAHQLFEHRGGEHDQDWGDWFQAQHDLFHVPAGELVETETDYTMTIAVPGFSAAQLNVAVDPNMLTVHGEAETNTRETEAGEHELYSEFDHRALFRQVELPTAVAPDDVRAYLQDGLLVVHLPKAKATTVELPVAGDEAAQEIEPESRDEPQELRAAAAAAGFGKAAMK
ncbi:MAG: Hsp20 family protein [Acidobacteria bacterium]|nr:Hsp20 family protein [Acidobacteriota bacterium]